MNTNFKKNEDFISAYQEKFNKIENELSEVAHLTQMLSYRFLSEIEILTDEREISRKELAQSIGVSPSYLTQLYRGVKPLNFETLAKIEFVLDFRFEIKAVEKSLLEIDHNIETVWNENQINSFIEKFKCEKGSWVYRNHRNINLNKDIKNRSEEDYIIYDDEINVDVKQKIA